MKNKPIANSYRDDSIAEALARTLPPTMTLHVGGHTYTPLTLAALVRERSAAAAAVNRALGQLHMATEAYTAVDARTKPALHELRSMAVALFGPGSSVLHAFGLGRPPRPPVA